jgi:hypothetical protein
MDSADLYHVGTLSVRPGASTSHVAVSCLMVWKYWLILHIVTNPCSCFVNSHSSGSLFDLLELHLEQAGMMLSGVYVPPSNTE